MAQANASPANIGHIPPSVQADQERLLSVLEARQKLGLSHSGFYALLKKGTLPSLTIGRSRKIRLSDFASFIARTAA